MDKKFFLSGMRYIDNFYQSFKFDFENDSKLEIWHDALSVIPEHMFGDVVKTYCKTNQFAPQSPHSILDVYVSMASTELTPEQAWEIVDKNLHRGISGYQTLVNGKIVYRNDFYKSIEEYPLITQVCKDIESSLRDVTSDNKSYVKHEFKEVYKTVLERKNTVTLLTGDDKLKIEG